MKATGIVRSIDETVIIKTKQGNARKMNGFRLFCPIILSLFYRCSQVYDKKQICYINNIIIVDNQPLMHYNMR